ncbi:MAG TPA: hypothetical protein VK470_02285, partial [Bacteroidota bacterium]|nr:hypothetical protein [Bacteroidota bacterium]
MYILHLSILDGRCVLWSERSSEAEAPKRRGRPPAMRKVRTSPYDGGADLLRMLSAEDRIVLPEEIRTSFRKKKPLVAYAWLPSTTQSPIASSPLIDERAETASAVHLAAWEIAAFACNPMEVMMFLSAIGRGPVLVPGIVAGGGLTFVCHVMQLAGSLVARQQFVPSLIRHAPEKVSEAKFSARWKPVVTGADIDRVAMLAAAMPPVLCALSDPTAVASPMLNRKASVDALLEMFVNIMVCSTARRDEQRKAMADRPSFSNIHDQWLLALQSNDGLMPG